MAYIADIGYDAAYGARPLKRAIQKEVETPLARKLIAGEVSEGDTVNIVVTDDQIDLVVDKAVHGSTSHGNT